MALLLAASVALAVLALARLGAAWRDRQRRPLRFGHWLLVALLVALSCSSALLCLAAADTALRVLLG